MSPLPIKSDRGAPGLAVSPSDRRAHQRFQWKGTASIHILPNGPDFVGVLQDLSEGGCAIEVGFLIPAQVGCQMEVDMIVRGVTLKRMGILRNIQIIRRTEQETRAGIEFIEDNSPNSQRYRLLTRNLIAQDKSPDSGSDGDTLVKKLWSKIARLGS